MSAYIERAELVDDLLEMAVNFLEHDAWLVDARVHAGADPKNDDLYRKAHMLGEDKETVRRFFADSIIALRPDWLDRVRKVSKFPAVVHTSGAVYATTTQQVGTPVSETPQDEAQPINPPHQ